MKQKIENAELDFKLKLNMNQFLHVIWQVDIPVIHFIESIIPIIISKMSTMKTITENMPIIVDIE